MLRQFGAMAMAGLLPALPGQAAGQQASAAPPAFPPRFTRPPLDSDEGGLWALMDREETRLRRGPFEVQDPALTAYLTALACRLGGDHCPDMRVHVVRAPLANASMAPNGMLQVWTGLLLRVENESQLAAVLGHEMGHYLERHTLQRMQDLKGKSAAATVMAMFGVVGLIGQLGMAASAFAFSREQEQQADVDGVRLMRDAGYDPAQAALVWDNLIAELEVTGGLGEARRSALFASHPPPAQRREMLAGLAAGASGITGTAEYRTAIARHRLDWLRDELRRGQYEESLVLFGRLLRAQPGDAELLFARGEVYRLRGTPADDDLALADLGLAAATDGAPADTFRSLGLLHRRRGDDAAAAQALRRYLALAPQAPDAALIHSFLPEPRP